MQPYETKYITRNGLRFRVDLFVDDDSDTPWDREDGHGPVTNWTQRDKAPGKRVLAEDGRFKRFYDFAEAVRIARRDGWDAAPYGGTNSQRAARAAEADFKRLRAWCRDEWHYCGIVVTEAPDEDEDPAPDFSNALWGIESDASIYIDETAEELADDAAAEYVETIGESEELELTRG